MRNRGAIAVSLILLVGCIGPDAEAPEEIQRDPAKMTVRVDVTGDTTLGRATYGVLLDGIQVADVTPNKPHEIPVTTGPHFLSFKVGPDPLTALGISVTRQSWCNAVPATSQRVNVNIDGSSAVAFRADCPPLVGEATLLVKVLANAVTTTETLITARRIIGPAYTMSRTVPLGQTVELKVPVGIYTISPGAPCKPPYVYLYIPTEHLLRENAREQATLSVNCP